MSANAMRVAVSSFAVLSFVSSCVVSFGDYPVADLDGSAYTAPSGWPDSGGDSCTCTPPVPAGWDGPVALAVGTPSSPAACPPGFVAEPQQLNQDLELACDACSCSVGCSHTLEFFTGGQCTTSLGKNTAIETCTSGTVNGVTGVSVVTSAKCVPSPASPAPKPPTWSKIAKLCSPKAAACDAGPGCMPSPGAAEVCVHRSEDAPCPSASPYSNKRLFHAGYAGTHACTACACTGSAASANCGTVRIFGGPGCTNETAACAPDESCCTPVAHPTPVVIDGTKADPAIGTPCQPSGGQPEPGTEPTLTSPATLCCL